MKILVVVFASIRTMITSTLLVVKTENISEHKKNAHSDGNSSAFKRLLETLLLAITLFTSDTDIFVFTHIRSVVKPVHIFMTRSRVCKSRAPTFLQIRQF